MSLLIDDNLALPAGDVHLWMCFEDAIGDPAVEVLGRELMAEDERDRMQRFMFARDRRRYLLTRLLARQVLARYLGLEPQSLEFRANHYGRPYLAEQTACADGPVSFNLSHTKGLIVMAVTRAAAIGVDAESVHRTVAPDVGRLVFAPFELEAMAALPAHRRRERFLELWTLKESYVKARGMGMSLPLARFGFHLPRSNELSLEFSSDFNDIPARWDVRQLRTGNGHVLALCVERSQGPRRLITREFVPPRAIGVMYVPVTRSTSIGR